jgi:Ca-activated chloride channel family protein
MNKSHFTYRLKGIGLAIIVWELIFWTLTGGLLYLLGFLDDGAVSKMGFKNEGALWLMILLFPIVGVYFFNLYSTNKITRTTNQHVRELLLAPVNSVNSFMRFFFYRNTIVLLIFALAQPVFGTKKVSGTLESMELVVCLDISNSMNTKDISPELSRLEISKRAIIQMVNNLHGEKIGLCLFAGSAFVQLPLTTDYNAAKLFISDISTGMISSQGTDIAAALETSRDMFSEQKTSKAILLVTDGENHERDPRGILTTIKEKNIALSILGIGTTSGGPVPVNPDRPELGYKTSPTGSTVVSRINPSLMRSLASQGGGSATITNSEFPDLRELLTEINQMKRTKLRDLQFDMKENRYRIPLFGAFLFWLFYLFLNRYSLVKSDQ